MSSDRFFGFGRKRLFAIGLLLWLFVLFGLSSIQTVSASDEQMEEPEWCDDEEAYLISNLDELNWIRNDLEADYILVDDIDASETVNWNDGEGWKPIVTLDPLNFFTGTFNGQG